MFRQISRPHWKGINGQKCGGAEKAWRQISNQIFLVFCCWKLIENSHSNWNLDRMPLFHIQGHTSFRYKGLNASWSFTSQNIKIYLPYFKMCYLKLAYLIFDITIFDIAIVEIISCRGDYLASKSLLKIKDISNRTKNVF